MKLRWGVAAALAVVTAVTTGAVISRPTHAAAQGIDWQPCPGVSDVDCGSVTVPIDWAHPDRGTIHVALARRKATDPASRIGSILMDPGGPGGSGVTQVEQGWTLSPEITRRFDTVGFGPRGVGASNPVRCGTGELHAPYPAIPHDEKEFQQLSEYNRKLGESCDRITGPLAGFVDTASVVRDMDAIRAALGDAKLTYFGHSYGTLMGEQYAETFPTHVRAMVLDGNMDHSEATTWGFLRSQAESVQKVFDQFVSWCGRSAGCALHGQDVHAVMADLYRRAEGGTLTDPETHKSLAPLDLLGLVSDAFNGPSWTQLAGTLKSMRAGSGTGSGASTLAAKDDGSSVNPFPSVFCEDWNVPVRSFAELDGYRTKLASLAPDMKMSEQSWTAVTGCVGWPDPVRNPQHPLSVHGAPPLLMLNSRYDPATPYVWAENASHQSGAVLLTYDGVGHGAYFKHSSCVTDAADTYLVTGKAPAAGTHCPAVEPS